MFIYLFIYIYKYLYLCIYKNCLFISLHYFRITEENNSPEIPQESTQSTVPASDQSLDLRCPNIPGGPRPLIAQPLLVKQIVLPPLPKKGLRDHINVLRRPSSEQSVSRGLLDQPISETNENDQTHPSEK
jgi:hypothetical protein